MRLSRRAAWLSGLSVSLMIMTIGWLASDGRDSPGAGGPTGAQSVTIARPATWVQGTAVAGRTGSAGGWNHSPSPFGTLDCVSLAGRQLNDALCSPSNEPVAYEGELPVGLLLHHAVRALDDKNVNTAIYEINDMLGACVSAKLGTFSREGYEVPQELFSGCETEKLEVIARSVETKLAAMPASRAVDQAKLNWLVAQQHLVAQEQAALAERGAERGSGVQPAGLGEVDARLRAARQRVRTFLEGMAEPDVNQQLMLDMFRYEDEVRDATTNPAGSSG